MYGLGLVYNERVKYLVVLKNESTMDDQFVDLLINENSQQNLHKIYVYLEIL